MNIMTFPTGVMGANTYFVVNEETKECIIIDPGGSFDLICEAMQNHRLKPKHILLTHGHFDHIGALEQVRDYYKSDVYAHADCSRAIFDPLLNLSVYASLPDGRQAKCEPAENLLVDGQELELCGLKVKAVHAPGHSKGSMVYVINHCVFTGDVLFKLSIGRTDFLGSDPNAMHQSLIKLKKIIPPEYKLLPGHGEETHMSYEIDNNPFMSQL